MRTLSLTALLLLAALSPAAPALAEKPPRWEYAELTYRSFPGRAAFTAEDGTEVPAVPASTSVRWITGAGEVELKSWAELAEKLKTPFKKEGTAAFQKIQMLNILGGEGWELMEQAGGTTVTQAGGFGGGGPKDRGPGARGGLVTTAATTWLLKRRVP